MGSAVGWVRKILRVGRVVEDTGPGPGLVDRIRLPECGVRCRSAMSTPDRATAVRWRSRAAFGPVYDAERFGARLVASPRHADALLVTGVVTRNMAEPLRNTVAATPQPRVVIACGDCALNRGVFEGAYGVVGAVGDVVPVDVRDPGMPAHAGRDRRCAAVGDGTMTATLSTARPAAATTLGHRRLRRGRLRCRDCLCRSDRVVDWPSRASPARGRVVHIGWLLPLSGVQLDLDPLGGFFIALTGAVAFRSASTRSATPQHLALGPLVVLPLFVAAMLLVPAAGSVTTFLLAWELMAIASLVLVLAEHTRAEVRAAGLFYAVMTQLGFVAILVGLMVLSAAGGGDRFADLTRIPDGARTAVFVLTLAGFGSKAGLVPLHAWLPRAHPEAPSPVSALMSAAMVNLGIYGIVRFDLQLLGPGPRWWGLTLLVGGRRLGGLRRAAGIGGDGSQTAACLFDDREHGTGHACAWRGDAACGVRRRLCCRSRDGRGDAAPGRARGVQVPRVPGRRVGAGGDRAARSRPAGRAGPADAGHDDSVRYRRAGCVGSAARAPGSSASGC